MVDCHVHSIFSKDSCIEMNEGILAAQLGGLAGVIFTDHYEYDYVHDGNKFQFNVEQRDLFLTLLQKKHQDSFVILSGIEVGVQPHVLPRLEALISQYAFDFVIASVHSIDRQNVGVPLYFSGKQKCDVVCRYLQEILLCAKQFDNYDVIGHIGYICRYMPFKDKTLAFQDYRDLIDEILRHVIEHGHGIEVNTSGLRQGLSCTIPSFDIIERYRNLGGEIITIGSDSHKASHVGSNFGVVTEQLKTLGFVYATYFSQRKPVFYKI